VQTDQELINKVKEDQDDQSLIEIINRHSGVYHSMVDKFLSGDSNNAERNNLLQDKEFTIYNSVMKYDSSRGAKFPTYLANEAKWKCLNTLTKKKKFRECPIDEVTKEPHDDDYLEVNQKSEVFSLFINFVEQEKDPRMKKIIDIRYNSCSNKVTPWRKVAHSLGMSIQGVINIHNRCLSKFKKQSEDYV